MTAIVTRLLPGVMAALLLAPAIHEAKAGLAPNWEESGQASWYGRGFDGHRTSMGTTFDSGAMTAAHDQLPLGTKIRVTTQETGRSVVVTITDRMPPKRLRVIDLSKAAASQLGIVSAGVGMVTLTEAHSTIRNEIPEEVAEAPDEMDGVSPLRRGRRHTHHGARTVSARHGYYPARSAIRARH